jgi:hypothetical protein
MITAKVRITKVISSPIKAVASEILLSGRMAPTPITVNKYFTRSNNSVASFSRLLWCACFTHAKCIAGIPLL